MLNYPVNLLADSNGSTRLEFPDITIANAVGDDEDEALLNALDALETALEIFLEQRQPIPLPSKARKGQKTVSLPALESSKVLLWNEMLHQNMRKAELARRLKVHMPQIDRLFDLRHSSKIEFVEEAARALGKSLNISLA